MLFFSWKTLPGTGGAEDGFDTTQAKGEKQEQPRGSKNILVNQTIQNIHVLCWFLLAAVCLQMSGKWLEEAFYVKIPRAVTASASNGESFHLSLSLSN